LVKRDLAVGKMTPRTVSAYAALMLPDDRGAPISPAPHHRLWLGLLCDERIDKLLIVAPPDSAKTSWSLAFLATWIGFNPGKSAIISSVSDDVATKRSVSVRSQIESPTWQALFPDLRPVHAYWEQQAWMVAKEGQAPAGSIHRTLTAYGTGSSIVGSRADLLIGDDLLDFDNTRTAHQRELVDHWFENSFLSRRKASGRVVLIGTSWNSEDLLSKIRREDTGWLVCHTPMLDDSGDGFYANLQYPDGWKYEMLGERIGV
jgi:hypothetical protein